MTVCPDEATNITRMKLKPAHGGSEVAWEAMMAVAPPAYMHAPVKTLSAYILTPVKKLSTNMLGARYCHISLPW